MTGTPDSIERNIADLEGATQALNNFAQSAELPKTAYTGSLCKSTGTWSIFARIGTRYTQHGRDRVCLKRRGLFAPVNYLTTFPAVHFTGRNTVEHPPASTAVLL